MVAVFSSVEKRIKKEKEGEADSCLVLMTHMHKCQMAKLLGSRAWMVSLHVPPKMSFQYKSFCENLHLLRKSPMDSNEVHRGDIPRHQYYPRNA